MMRKLGLLGLFAVISAGVCFSQATSNDSLPQNSTSGMNETLGQNSTTSPNIMVDCTDPSQIGSPDCIRASQSQIQRQYPYPSSTVGLPQLGSPFDSSQYPFRTIPPNPSQLQHPKTPVWPETEFEQMVADSVGRPLPLFGQSMFDQPPSTFAPMDLLQVPDDYIIGAGDTLQIRVWGQITADVRASVDRAGQIYIPQVGPVSVAGVHYGELDQYLKNVVSKIFRNFDLTVSVGRLRSIQVLVLGNARYPGTYTISSLSTLVNAIFTSGGPTPQGSLRHIQVRRDGTTITDFDFYDL